MGTDTTENEETVPSLHSFTVHHTMCTELIKLIARISEILPDIEAARPGNPAGRDALCTLSRDLAKAKLLLQYCKESSKLYLALTGDKILARCHRVRTSLEHSLCQIKNMVPLALAVKISQIADDLRGATFILDSSEEEARKAIRGLLHQCSSTSDALESSEVQALKIAALKLHIASHKELVIEKRSIRKLLDDAGKDDPLKKKILTYLLYLLKKYGELILQEIKDSNADSSRSNESVEIKPNMGCMNYISEANILNMPIPPEEFKCPISSRLMYDPVVIASGLTYERVWIEKWFEEGHDTCPKSQIKLANLSMTPNVDMKNLISKWCSKFGVTIPDPHVEPESPEFWENSIASFGSSMNDIRLPIDFSNISLGGLDNCYYPDSLRFNGGNGLGLKSEPANDDPQRFQSDSNAEETDLEFPSSLSELPWESKCKVIEDMKKSIDRNGACPTLSETVMDQFARFLKDASKQQDSRAQKIGSELFLSLLRKNRFNKLNVPETILTTLASLLHSEVTFEVLTILELLSGHRKCGYNFIASGVLTSVVEFLDSKIEVLQECAVKIFYNLSSKNDICSHIVSLGCIPKLVSLLNNEDLSGNCIFILKNLCHTEEARIYFTETKGCIAAFAQLLETGSVEAQEHAVIILLSLCSQRVEYCELVMAEGIIPPLCNISVNGSDKGKAAAFELRRLLKDVQHHEEEELYVQDLPSSNDASKYSERKKPSKKSGFLGMNISIFSKRNPLKR